MEIDGKKYIFNIYETKYDYINIDIQIYVFNICDLKSFNNMKIIVDKTYKLGKIVFVGFKWNENVVVKNEEINKFAEKYNAKVSIFIPNEDVECLKKVLVSLHQ